MVHRRKGYMRPSVAGTAVEQRSFVRTSFGAGSLWAGRSRTRKRMVMVMTVAAAAVAVDHMQEIQAAAVAVVAGRVAAGD